MEEDPAIIRLNIAHYQALLKLDIDDDKRNSIQQLLRNLEDRLRNSEVRLIEGS